MLRRRQINADPGRSKVQAALAAAIAVLRSVAWGIEERAWDWGRRLAVFLEPAKWQIERAVWFVEQRALWPLQERATDRRPSISGQLAGTVAVVALAIGVVSLAVLSLQREDGDPKLRAAATQSRVAVAAAPAPESSQAREPVLQGAPPTFEVEGARAVGSDDSDAVVASASSPTSSDSAGTGGDEGAAAASASASKPVSAGPAAMKVARRFADAFVHYEIGERKQRAEQIFSETATPQLASALAERPPRQPASVEVPQARVLNLVPGPRRGKTYTVSASLLRIGTTSELRLELKKKNGNWVITDVRG